MKRLAPNTAITPDQLAGAIGWHGESVRNWLRGDCGISADATDEVINFFIWTGDHTFILEIYPQLRPLYERKAEAEQALELVKGLRSLVGAPSAA